MEEREPHRLQVTGKTKDDQVVVVKDRIRRRLRGEMDLADETFVFVSDFHHSIRRETSRLSSHFTVELW